MQKSQPSRKEMYRLSMCEDMLIYCMTSSAETKTHVSSGTKIYVITDYM